MLEARILPGLPPYGERAISFPEPNAYSEGLVVEFCSDDGSWVGNFQIGWNPLKNSLHPELGAQAFVVVAGGQGYVVDTVHRTLVRYLRTDVRRIWFEPELGAMVISNDLSFAAFNATDVLWISRRISWDGMREVKRSGLTVTGEAYAPFEVDGEWKPFELDLRTGFATGGTYNGPPM